MRFINDLLVCFFFPLFQVFLFQTLSPSSVSLPLTSLSVCLHVYLCLFVCLPVCLSVSLFLFFSLSSYLSLTSDTFFFFLSLSISVYNSQYLYLTHWYNFFLSCLVRPLPICHSLSLTFSLSLSLSLFLSLSHFFFLFSGFIHCTPSLSCCLSYIVSISLSLSFSLFCVPLLSFLKIIS